MIYNFEFSILSDKAEFEGKINIKKSMLKGNADVNYAAGVGDGS